MRRRNPRFGTLRIGRSLMSAMPSKAMPKQTSLEVRRAATACGRRLHPSSATSSDARTASRRVARVSHARFSPTPDQAPTLIGQMTSKAKKTAMIDMAIRPPRKIASAMRSNLLLMAKLALA